MQSDLSTCPICYQGYNLSNRSPKILINCGHTVCMLCITQLKKEQDPKCPFDKIKISLNVPLPVNYALTEHLDKGISHDMCKIHNRLVISICKNERSMVCKDCLQICSRKHHETKSITDLRLLIVENEFTLKRTQEKWDAKCCEFEAQLQEGRQTLLKILENRFDDIISIAKFKQHQLANEIDAYINFQRNEFNNNMKEFLNIKVNFSRIMNKCKDVLMTHSAEKLLDEEILSVKVPKIDEKLFQGQSKLASKLLSDIESNLAYSLSQQIELLSSLTLETLNEENSMIDDDLKVDFTCPKLPSIPTDVMCSLNFSPNEALLKISTSEATLQMINMDEVEWKCIKNLELKCTSEFFTDENMNALAYIMSKLKHITNLKVDFQEYKTITRDQALHLFSICFWKPQDLQSIILILNNTNITDQTIIWFSEKVLSKVLRLKEMELYLMKTGITDKSISIFATQMLRLFDILEGFGISLSGTKVSRESVRQLFSKMPALIDFWGSFSNLDLNDDDFESFTNETLLSTPLMQKFYLALDGTKISDIGLAKLVKNIQDVKRLGLYLEETQAGDQTAKAIIEKVNTMNSCTGFKASLGRTQISEALKIEIRELKQKFLYCAENL